MKADTPEAIHRLFEQYVNSADLASITTLYRPDAKLVDREGAQFRGVDEICRFIGGLLSVKPHFRISRTRALVAGDIAVLNSRWDLVGTGPDGARLEDGGWTQDIACRNPDGSWHLAVDNPYGYVYR